MLSIITKRPIVTTTKRTKPNQPSTMADVPTPDLTLPLPMSCAIVVAATDAVCCQRTDTSTKTDATKMSAKAAWDTGREGNGLTSPSEPVESISSCQPGNVAKRIKQRKARMTATILDESANATQTDEVKELTANMGTPLRLWMSMPPRLDSMDLGRRLQSQPMPWRWSCRCRLRLRVGRRYRNIPRGPPFRHHQRYLPSLLPRQGPPAPCRRLDYTAHSIKI